MPAYLTTRPPVRDQWFTKRNKPLTGCTVLHTAESVMDAVGPDTGAEAVAEFIRTRTTPGSYHDLVDSDSAMHLVEYGHGAYHDGTGSNNWALSLSFACRTSDWRAMSAEKRRGFLRQGAIAFARQQAYRRSIGAPLTELRLITKAQSDAGQSGFTYHGLRDPGRRSDPGIAAPNLFPFEEFIAECRAVLAGTPTAQEEPDLDANQAKMLEHLYVTLTPGIEGVKHHGEAYRRVLNAETAAQTAANAVTPGIEGVKHHGVLYRAVLDAQGKAAGLEAAVKALSGALAAQDNGLTAADIEAAVRRAMADTVKVDVTVDGPTA